MLLWQKQPSQCQSSKRGSDDDYANAVKPRKRPWPLKHESAVGDSHRVRDKKKRKRKKSVHGHITDGGDNALRSGNPKRTSSENRNIIKHCVRQNIIKHCVRQNIIKH